MRKSNVSKTLAYEKILEKRPIYLQVAREYEKLHKNLTVSEKTYLYVYAPVMMEFTQWLLNTAMNERREKLYFLSRDGYQMYLVTKELAKVFDIDIECRYINVSRYALRIPKVFSSQTGTQARVLR